MKCEFWSLILRHSVIWLMKLLLIGAVHINNIFHRKWAQTDWFHEHYISNNYSKSFECKHYNYFIYIFNLLYSWWCQISILLIDWLSIVKAGQYLQVLGLVWTLYVHILMMNNIARPQEDSHQQNAKNPGFKQHTLKFKTKVDQLSIPFLRLLRDMNSAPADSHVYFNVKMEV